MSGVAFDLMAAWGWIDRGWVAPYSKSLKEVLTVFAVSRPGVGSDLVGFYRFYGFTKYEEGEVLSL